MSQAEQFAEIARRVLRDLSHVEREQVCCGDTTLQQFETLRAIHDSKSALTGEIAERLQIDISTASRNLSVLERNGYLTRARALIDGRQIENKLTAKGRRCVETLCCDERLVFASVFARIPTAQRGSVIEALRTLSKALNSDDAAVEDVAPQSKKGCCP